MRDRADRGVTSAPDWQVWAALGTVYVVWGSTYLAIRVVVGTMPPFLSSGMRFLIASAILAALLLIRSGPSRLRVDRTELASIVLVGGLLLLLGNGLVAVGEQQVPSALAALIIAATPLWVLLLRRATHERIPPVTLAGVAAGFVGVAVLVVPRGLDGSISVWSALLLVAASFFWATGSFLSSRVRLPKDPFVSTAYQLACGGGLLLLAGTLTGEWGRTDPASFSAASLWALAYLVVFGSLVAYSAFTWLLQHAPVSKVATYAYVNPVVAVVLGAVILNEEITPVMLFGAATIIVAVAFVVTSESGRMRGRARVPEAVDVVIEPAAGATD